MTATAATGPAAKTAPAFDKRILLAIPEFEYGDPALGPGLEPAVWLPTFEALAREVAVFPVDEARRVPCSLDAQLLETVDRLRPDLVVFSTCRDDVSPETLRLLRDRTETLAFFWDDHWRFDTFSSRYATLYDHVVTTDQAVVGRYRALGGSPILSQYAGIVPADPQPPIEDETEFLYDVSFVGGTHSYRAWLIDWLRRQGVAVETFGAGWPNGRVGFDEMNEIFRRSRINLNISNSRQHDTRYLLADPANYAAARSTGKSAEQIKARHFEIPMAGGCELTFYAIGIEDYLAVGREFALYTTPEDCLLQIERLLSDGERRRAIARAGWERCRAEHTYEQRIRGWLEAVWPE